MFHVQDVETSQESPEAGHVQDVNLEETGLPNSALEDQAISEGAVQSVAPVVDVFVNQPEVARSQLEDPDNILTRDFLITIVFCLAMVSAGPSLIALIGISFFTEDSINPAAYIILSIAGPIALISGFLMLRTTAMKERLAEKVE